MNSCTFLIRLFCICCMDARISPNGIVMEAQNKKIKTIKFTTDSCSTSRKIHWTVRLIEHKLIDHQIANYLRSQFPRHVMKFIGKCLPDLLTLKKTISLHIIAYFLDFETVIDPVTSLRQQHKMACKAQSRPPLPPHPLLSFVSLQISTQASEYLFLGRTP